jgi:hypothetical protein
MQMDNIEFDFQEIDLHSMVYLLVGSLQLIKWNNSLIIYNYLLFIPFQF